MIIQISGKLRKGKGILESGLTLTFAQRGYLMLCNHSYNFRNCKKISFLDFMRLLEKPRVSYNCGIDIDELSTWVDSYTTTKSDSNRFASYLINQSAKLGYDPIIYTTQRGKRADINYREMKDVHIKATKLALCSTKKCPVGCPYLDKCYFHYELLDPDIDDIEVPLGKSFNIPFSVASKWWNLYDTFEGVQPVGLKQFLAKLEKSQKG